MYVCVFIVRTQANGRCVRRSLEQCSGRVSRARPRTQETEGEHRSQEPQDATGDLVKPGKAFAASWCDSKPRCLQEGVTYVFLMPRSVILCDTRLWVWFEASKMWFEASKRDFWGSVWLQASRCDYKHLRCDFFSVWDVASDFVAWVRAFDVT